MIESEKLNSIAAKTQSDLVSAQAEIANLESELANYIAAAEQTSDLQDQLEEASTQADVALKQIDSLTSDIKELKNQLGVKTEELDAAVKSQAKHDDQRAELIAQAKLIERRANDAELKLAETSESLTKQQTSYAELETITKQDRDELTLQISNCSDLEASIKSLENQMVEAQQELTGTQRLLEQEKSTREEIEKTFKQQAEELSVLSSGKSNAESELKPLEMRAQKAERQLKETVELLEREQKQHVDSARKAQDTDAELNALLSRNLELETSVKSLEAQIQEACEELNQTIDELDKTKLRQVKLEETTEQQKAQLSQKELQYTQLEAELRETVESNVNELTIESEKFESQGHELDELRVALQNEKEYHLEVLGKLKSSQLRIAELEQQPQAPSVNESNYIEMAKKVVKYKTAYRESEARAAGLAEQKSRMSDLATEYLAVGKFLKGDLDAQRAITADLRRRLDNGSFNGSSPPNIKLLVQESARVHVLELKANFEERIKKKNRIIRKLKNKEPIRS